MTLLVKVLKQIAKAQKFDLETPIDLSCTEKNIQASLEAASENSLLRFRKITLKKDVWKRISTPTLCFMQKGFIPIAILPKAGGTLYFYDPRTENKKILTSEITQDLSTLAYCFYPRYPKEILTPKTLIQFTLSTIWPEFRLILFISTLGAIVSLITPIVTRWLFDVVIPNRYLFQFWQIMAALFVMIVSGAFFMVFRTFATLRLSALISNRVNTALWDRLFSLPAPFFHEYSTGLLTQRISAVETTRNTLTGQTISFLFSILFSLIYIGPMLYYSWQLGITGMMSVVLGLGLSLFAIKYKLPIAVRVFDRGAKIQGYLVEMVSGISKIRMNNAESRAYAHWDYFFSANQKDRLHMMTFDNIVSVIAGIFPILSTILIFYVASSLLEDPNFTLGKLLAFQAAYIPFSLAIMQMGSVGISLISLWPVWERAKLILEQPLESPRGNFLKTPLKGEIIVKNLTFRYDPKGKPLFDRVNFTVNSGEFVAITGPSGSGKSTLLRLLLGLENREQGNIYFDGIELDTLNFSSLRKQVGSVLQTSRIFAGTIHENITLGREITPDDLVAAIKNSCFDEVLQMLPLGVHTPIPNGGTTLSGGQRQRLLLARALATRPSILFLDEPTSSLDSKLQEKVMENLRQLKITSIVVAHRLSTIKHADKVYNFEKGNFTDVRKF